MKEPTPKFAIPKLEEREEKKNLNEKYRERKEKKMRTDEMKANDNYFLACIHIHCSNVERESVEISAHQPINIVRVSIFSSPQDWMCVCESANSVWYFNRLLNVHSKTIAFITATRSCHNLLACVFLLPTMLSTNHSSNVLKKYQFYISETKTFPRSPDKNHHVKKWFIKTRRTQIDSTKSTEDRWGTRKWSIWRK